MYFNRDRIFLPNVTKLSIPLYPVRFSLQRIDRVLVAATPTMVAPIPIPPDINVRPLRRLKLQCHLNRINAGNSSWPVVGNGTRHDFTFLAIYCTQDSHKEKTAIDLQKMK